ncbi:MAG: DUF6702 family protein [Aridibacter sp.]
MLKKLTKCLVVVIFMSAANSFAYGKHKYHTSFTRVDYNTQENLLEISIKVFAHDLLPSLEKQHKQKIDLENTKDIDKILEDYLAEKFVFKTKSNQIKQFKWIGKELETEVILFYIEIPFDEELEGAELKNTLFFENFREQVNLVHFKYEDKKADLMFKVGDSFKKITHNTKSDK